jgi:cobalt-zinc-cadmium efflux system outer membrane protein
MQSLSQLSIKKPHLAFLCAGLLWILFPHTASAEQLQNVNVISLQQALNLAMQGNPELAVSIREREAIDGVRMQASVRPNPSISTSIQDTRSENRQTFLQLNQEIELGNKRQVRMDAADALYSKANLELELKKAEIHANTVAAFYEVLVAQEKLKLTQSSVEIANAALNASAKRVQAGKSSPVEETKSNIAASTARIDSAQAKTQLLNARKKLAFLWGSTPTAFEAVEGNVTFVPEFASLPELVTKLEQSPAVKLAKSEIASRNALTKIEQSKATPNITLSAGMVNNQELGGVNQALLGLSMPIPIFDRNQGNLQEAVSREYKAQDELALLQNQLETQLATQYEQFIATKLMAKTYQTEILPGAQSAFDAATKGFQAGKFDFLDVLDAQRTLFQAKNQFIQALLNAQQAVAEIERILGDVVDHSTHRIQE